MIFINIKQYSLKNLLAQHNTKIKISCHKIQLIIIKIFFPEKLF